MLTREAERLHITTMIHKCARLGLLLVAGAVFSLSSLEPIAGRPECLHAVTYAARGASSAERSIFLHYAPRRPGNLQLSIDGAAVAGPWAYVGYYNRYSGITALFRRDTRWRWQVVAMTGGALTPYVMVGYDRCMSMQTARSLYHRYAQLDTPSP